MMRPPRLFLAALLVATFIPALLYADPAAAGVEDLDSQEIAAVQRINEIRSDLGLDPFTVSPILTETAEWMAQDLALRDDLDHTDSLGRGLRERFNAFGYPSNTFIRENLAAGYTTGAAVVVGWQNSPGHRANNEADDVITVGIARVYSENTTYKWFWVLTFGSHEDAGTISVDGEIVTPTPTPTATPTPSATPPIGTGTGTFASPFPESGVGLNVWNGGSVSQLAEGAAQGGARSIFVTVEGSLVGYVIGAPAFVNAAFNAAFPDGEVAAGTVLIIVV